MWARALVGVVVFVVAVAVGPTIAIAESHGYCAPESVSDSSYSGTLDSTDDVDTYGITVETGDRLWFGLEQAADAGDVHVSVIAVRDGPGTTTPGPAYGDNDLDVRNVMGGSATVDDESRVKVAPSADRTTFQVDVQSKEKSDDFVCVYAFSTEDDAPQEYTLRVSANGEPSWWTSFRETPTSSPDPTAADSDGDGVPDDEDYAPRDPDVQDESDVDVQTTGTSQTGDGPGVTVAIGAVVGAVLLGRGLQGRER